VRITYTKRADRCANAINDWWQANGDDPDHFIEELRETLDRLRDNPELGPVYVAKRSRRQVRRILLTKTGHYLYYRINHSADLIEVAMIWGTSRARGPVL